MLERRRNGRPTLINNNSTIPRIGAAPGAGFQEGAGRTGELQKYQATIADGPRAGGLYRIKLADRSLSREEVAQTLARMQQESGVVRLAAPTD